MVGAEPAQDAVQAQPGVRRRAVRAARAPGGLIEGVPELARDYRLVPAAGERPAEHPLAVPGAVGTGGVEERHAEVQRPVHGADRLVVVDLAPPERLPAGAPQRAADRPTAHPDGADLDPTPAQGSYGRHVPSLLPGARSRSN